MNYTKKKPPSPKEKGALACFYKALAIRFYDVLKKNYPYIYKIF